MFLATLLFTFLMGLLTHSALSKEYAMQALQVWYHGVVPALLPFMILSGIIVRTGMAEKLSGVFHLVLGRLFHASKMAGYVIFMGFLCGFPMGARTIAECRERGMITKKEGCWLLAFCNNLSPAYFLGFVVPLLCLNKGSLEIIGFYAIPFLYGLFLRMTLYRDLGQEEKASGHKEPSISFSDALIQSVQSAMDGILSLGGIMIFFSLFNLIPHLILKCSMPILGPLFEVTTGLANLKGKAPVYCLAALCFGGFSCIAQTAACLRNVDVRENLWEYVIHKGIQSLLIFAFYSFLP